MIHADPRNPRARQLHRLLLERIDEAELPPGLCVVIGGDGWMLASIHELGPDRVFMGLNAGRLGFLLNDLEGDEALAMDRVVDCLRQGSQEVHHFPQIEVIAWPLRGDPIRARAVNDVFVERVTGRTALLRVAVGGRTVVDQLACDGLVVATALGSTAYSFSAGGVPSHPQAPALHVTPICPHGPRLSPFLLPLSVEVEAEVLRPDSRPVRAFADGIEIGPVSRLCVRPMDLGVDLAFLPGHDFTATMIRKILKA